MIARQDSGQQYSHNAWARINDETILSSI